jgi:hypothetical protein
VCPDIDGDQTIRHGADACQEVWPVVIRTAFVAARSRAGLPAHRLPTWPASPTGQGGNWPLALEVRLDAAAVVLDRGMESVVVDWPSNEEEIGVVIRFSAQSAGMEENADEDYDLLMAGLSEYADGSGRGLTFQCGLSEPDEAVHRLPRPVRHDPGQPLTACLRPAPSGGPSGGPPRR